MSVYQVKTFADIYAAVLEDSKIQSGDTAALNRIKRRINQYYLNEVTPRAGWDWLRDSLDVSLDAMITTGTAAVTAASVTVTLSTAPAASKKGQLITFDGYPEVYRIAQHTAASTAVTLATPFNGSAAAAGSYTLWNDRLPLPVDCKETVSVRSDFDAKPLDGVGYERLLRAVAVDPKAEGRPYIYSTTDFADPAPFGAISGLSASTYRLSSGLVKSVVFAAAVSSYFSEGDRIEISGMGHYSYNGRWTISSLSTTTIANDTINYTALVPYAESSTADTAATAKLLSQKSAIERYRELVLYPAMVDTRLNLHVDYLKTPMALEDDSDEPLMPVEDRAVLVYAGLAFAWGALNRNPEEEAKYLGLAETKLGRMAGRIGDSLDYPRIVADPGYMASKRRRRSTPYSFTRND